jgi:hypothetical protein
MSEVGGPDSIGFFSSGYNSKYVTNVLEVEDWIKLIRLLVLTLHRVVIEPHYGDATDDGTPAGQNERQYKSNARKGRHKSKGTKGRHKTKPRQT